MRIVNCKLRGREAIGTRFACGLDEESGCKRRRKEGKASKSDYKKIYFFFEEVVFLTEIERSPVVIG